MWDERYREPGFAYGTQPNDFLTMAADVIPLGPVLCVGEGEGRNAVFLAMRGHAVTAVDASAVGLAKAAVLATERGVTLRTITADLAHFPIEEGVWSGAVSIFCHLEPDLRRVVHERLVRGLAPGGVFILEAYRPEQLLYGTGGPTKRELLYTLADLEADLSGFELQHAAELVREVHEGRYHNGRSAVVQIIARR
jgi:SAM-dependent methyltransferase